MSKNDDSESSSYYQGDIVKNLPIAKDLRPFIEAMADLIVADLLRYPDLDYSEGKTEPPEEPGNSPSRTDE